MNNPIRFVDPFGLDTLDNSQANFNFDLVKSGDILTSGGTVLNETVVTAKTWSREQKLMDRFKTDFLSKNEYDNRDYGPYIPPAIGLEASFGADIIVANANMKGGVAVDDNNIIGYVGGASGLGFSGSRMPSISFGLSIYAMDRSGASPNQFNLYQGLLGVNSDIQIGHGLMVGYSQSMIRNPNGSGYLRDPYGYSSYSLGVGKGFSNNISLTKPMLKINRK
ncbi:hypothetical protein [Marinilongibacter aquaticus]|uniref:hypothetical protein n=1 Tax=Marinilongibacter aquaticus TaxID=2975157 RepID=UPI0021BD7250|nr:hypothetical protein [Marinilongibacter aquaticus]